MSSDTVMSTSDVLAAPLQSSDSNTSVELQDIGVCYSLRVKKTDLTAFKKASGWNLPSTIGGSTMTRNYTVYCLGPDEWQLVMDSKKGDAVRKKLEKLAAKFTFSYADISHRNVMFNVSGPLTVSMINVGCPLDLSLDAFPINKCTRTVFEDAEILLVRTAADAFQVQTWRSFGPYLASFFRKIIDDNS